MMVLLLLFMVLPPLAAKSTRAQRAEERLVEQEIHRMESAQRRAASRVEDQLHSARRKADLLARTAAIEAWQDRTTQQYEQDISFGKYAHLYSVPAWPKELSFFNSPVQVAVDYTARRAHRCCDESGSYTNISYLMVGEEPKVKDLILASALTTTDNVTPAATKEFLSDLAETTLRFMSAHVEREVALSCAVSMKDNALTLGARLPFVEKVRTMRVWPDIDDTARSLLRDEDVGTRNTKFREYYGVNVATFVADVIERKGMRFDERVGQFDVGDAQFYVTASLFPQRVERWQIGAQLIIPSASDPDMSYFYPLQLGNGGFWSARVHAAVMGKRKPFGSPHLMTALTVGFPATVTRRVPRRIIMTSASSLGTELYGQDITIAPARNIDEPETTIAAFAGQTAELSLRPGMQVDFRCGTVIEPLITHGLQLDLFYHLQVNGGNRFYKSLPEEEWYVEPLTRDGLQIAHRAGASVLCQPNAHLHLRAGLEFTFAGIRTPLWFAATTSLSYEW